jgi:hypothetical protein
MIQSPFISKGLGKSRQRIILIFAAMFVALVSISRAQQRQGTSDRIIVVMDEHQPHPKALEHRAISAVVRSQVLPDRTIGKVTFDRSSGYPTLDAKVVKKFKGWKVPRSANIDTLIVPVTFSLTSRPLGSNPVGQR